MVASGRKLVERMDAAAIDIVAALWLFDLDPREWRFVVASPLVGTEGSLAFYARVQEILAKNPDELAGLSLRNIAALDPSDQTVQVLKKIVRTDRGGHGMRFSRSRFNNIYIEDAYIYRAA